MDQVAAGVRRHPNQRGQHRLRHSINVTLTIVATTFAFTPSLEPLLTSGFRHSPVAMICPGPKPSRKDNTVTQLISEVIRIVLIACRQHHLRNGHEPQLCTRSLQDCTFKLQTCFLKLEEHKTQAADYLSASNKNQIKAQVRFTLDIHYSAQPASTSVRQIGA
eukprot:984781-Amphidinium_carterae.1